MKNVRPDSHPRSYSVISRRVRQGIKPATTDLGWGRPLTRQADLLDRLATMDECADLSLAVRQVTLAVQRYRLRAARACFDMGATEMMALSQLYTEGPCTPTALAEFLSLTTASVTALLDRLERAGHVTRQRHPTDRRRLLVELNPNARATVAAMFAYTGQAAAHAAQPLSKTELAAVKRFLHDLVDAYDRIDPLAGLQDDPTGGDEHPTDTPPRATPPRRLRV